MMKKCSKCGQEKPATAEFFHRSKKGKYGVMGFCRECRNKKPIPLPRQPEDYERYGLQPDADMKRCTTCEEWKPETLEYFYKDKNCKDGLVVYCKSCCKKNRNYSAPWYSRQLAKMKARRWGVKKALLELFGGECVTCGYDGCIAAFEFHHINPEEKEFTISGSRTYGKSWDEILEEAKKCMLLCSNCHRELHYYESEESPEVNRDSETTLPDLLCEESEVSDVPLCLSVEEESSDFNWAEQS